MPFEQRCQAGEKARPTVDVPATWSRQALAPRTLTVKCTTPPMSGTDRVLTRSDRTVGRDTLPFAIPASSRVAAPAGAVRTAIVATTAQLRVIAISTRAGAIATMPIVAEPAPPVSFLAIIGPSVATHEPHRTPRRSDHWSVHCWWADFSPCRLEPEPSAPPRRHRLAPRTWQRGGLVPDRRASGDCSAWCASTLRTTASSTAKSRARRCSVWPTPPSGSGFRTTALRAAPRDGDGDG